MISRITWLLLAGIPLAAGYVVLGFLSCLLLIPAPVGKDAIRMSIYPLNPTGRTTLRNPKKQPAPLLSQLLWFTLAGLPLAILHIVCGALLLLSLFGASKAADAFRLVPLALSPHSQLIVSVQAATNYHSQLQKAAIDAFPWQSACRG